LNRFGFGFRFARDHIEIYALVSVRLTEIAEVGSGPRRFLLVTGQRGGVRHLRLRGRGQGFFRVAAGRGLAQMNIAADPDMSADAGVESPGHAGSITMPVSFKDLQEAFEFVCAAASGEHQAFLCKQSGGITCHSELADDLDPLPDDIDDPEKFLPIPDRRELDLGKPVALDFARQFLPGDFDEVRKFFSRRGAYARFKDLLARQGALDQWYDFEAKAEETALRLWCEDNSIELRD
jgi:hypothetical protein